MNMANVAISDSIAPAAQPKARAALSAMRSLGVVLGGLVGGWIQAKSGPVAPYAVGVLAASMASASLAWRQPETQRPGRQEPVVAAAAPTVGGGGGLRALRVLL